MVLGGSTEDRHSIYCRYPPEPGVLLLDCNNSARPENSLTRTLEGKGCVDEALRRCTCYTKRTFSGGSSWK